MEQKNDELIHKFRLDRDTLKNHRLGCFNFLVLTVEMTYSAVTRRHKRTNFRAPRLNPHLSRLCLPVSASQPHTSTSTTILPSEVSLKCCQAQLHLSWSPDSRLCAENNRRLLNRYQSWYQGYQVRERRG